MKESFGTEEECSDEEYYQDVDDYTFDEPVIDPSIHTNTVVQASEIIKSALVEIDRITSITETSPCSATLMLLKFQYLFYFHRYNTHEQSKKFETKLRKGALDTIMALQKMDKRWIDVKFIETSTETLIQCRRTLKYTYVFAFYLEEGAEKNLFEYLQSDLEKTTENLSGLLEKGEDQNIATLFISNIPSSPTTTSSTTSSSQYNNVYYTDSTLENNR
eukprot:gene20357-24422_t